MLAAADSLLDFFCGSAGVLFLLWFSSLKD